MESSKLTTYRTKAGSNKWTKMKDRMKISNPRNDVNKNLLGQQQIMGEHLTTYSSLKS
jgi:hypothetical protein